MYEHGSLPFFFPEPLLEPFVVENNGKCKRDLMRRSRESIALLLPSPLEGEGSGVRGLSFMVSLSNHSFFFNEPFDRLRVNGA